MVTTQQTRTKQIQVWGIKTHLTRLQTKNAKNSSNKNASNASDRNCHDESDRY